MRSTRAFYLGAAALAFAAASGEAAEARSLTLTGVGSAAVASDGGSGYVGPGDLAPGGKAWYGLRAYSAAAAAAGVQAVRLTRTDTHQCDVKVASSGDLATTVSNCSTTGDNGALLTNGSTGWCDATTCIGTELYDQTGNGFNQIGGTNPVLVFNCIGSRPCLDFGAGAWFNGGGITATAQPLTISAVALKTSGVTAQADILGSSVGAFFPSGGNPVNKVGMYFGLSVSATATDGAWHAVQLIANTTSSSIDVDGAVASGLNVGANTMSGSIQVGAQSSAGASKLQGKLVEVGLWPTNFSTGAGAQSGNMCRNQKAYWGLAASC